MRTTTPSKPRAHSIWRNLKTGHLYTVLLNGTHSETGEALVVYTDGREVWVRPLLLFLEKFQRLARPAH